MASITVRYYTHEETENHAGYPLRVVVENAVDMPEEILVFQRAVESAMDAQENALGDLFIKIADPLDLEELPVDPPEGPTETPNYRQKEVTLYFLTQDQLYETKGLIAGCINDLVRSVELADELTEMDEVTYNGS